MVSSLVDEPIGRGKRARSALLWIFAGLAVLLVAVVHGLMYPYDHDEEQYVAAGVLAKSLSLYKDFIYLQVPYYAVALSAVYSPFDGHYFLVGRLFSAALALTSILAFYFLAYRLSGSRLAAALITFVFCTCDVALHVFGLVRNDVFPLALGLLSLLTADIAISQSGRRGLWILSGILAAGAVGSKVSWLFLPASLFAVLLIRALRSRSREDWLALTCLVAGGLLGILPVAFFALGNPENFFYSNFTYHMSAPRIWYEANGAHELLDSTHHVLRFARLFVEPAIAVAGLLLLALGVWLVRQPAGLKNLVQSDRFLLPFVSLLMVIPLAYLPRPAQLQYTAPMAALLFLVAAALHGAATVTGKFRIAAGFWVAFALLGSFKGLYTLGTEFAQFPEGPVKEFAAHSQRIRETMVKAGLEERPIATMSPMQVLDARLPIYTELASGPFFFRSANDLPTDRIRSLKGLAPRLTEAFLDANPPGAIFLGYEYSWNHALAWGPDETLERYANDRKYATSPAVFGTGRLYVKRTAGE